MEYILAYLVNLFTLLYTGNIIRVIQTSFRQSSAKISSCVQTNLPIENNNTNVITRLFLFRTIAMGGPQKLKSHQKSTATVTENKLKT